MRRGLSYGHIEEHTQGQIIKKLRENQKQFSDGDIKEMNYKIDLIMQKMKVDN